MRKQKKDSPASDDDCYSLGEDGEEMELNESIQELKKITNVPQLQKKSSENPGSPRHDHVPTVNPV